MQSTRPMTARLKRAVSARPAASSRVLMCVICSRQARCCPSAFWYSITCGSITILWLRFERHWIREPLLNSAHSTARSWQSASDFKYMIFKRCRYLFCIAFCLVFFGAQSRILGTRTKGACPCGSVIVSWEGCFCSVSPTLAFSFWDLYIVSSSAGLRELRDWVFIVWRFLRILSFMQRHFRVLRWHVPAYQPSGVPKGEREQYDSWCIEPHVLFCAFSCVQAPSCSGSGIGSAPSCLATGVRWMPCPLCWC